jgi:2-C-methyl-D-erythritol 4-phosphate cytidylyltransferase
VPETVAVILAAGAGSRVGADTPKQFLDLDGTPVLLRTVNSLAWCDRVVLVHHSDFRELTCDLLQHCPVASKVELVPGGATRRESVAAALEALTDAADDVALVLQNAASPNTPRGLVEACVDGLRSHEVVQAYVPAVHTIFSHDGREVTEVLARGNLGYSADPTVYRLACLRRIVAAQRNSGGSGDTTIDTARALGFPALLIRSPESNVKLTTNHDLIVLQALLAPADNAPSGS